MKTFLEIFRKAEEIVGECEIINGQIASGEITAKEALYETVNYGLELHLHKDYLALEDLEEAEDDLPF
jgi:hypothetical protein